MIFNNNNFQSTNVYPEKIQQKFVAVKLFNIFYDNYIEYKHYINDILENFKVNGNILSQFKKTNDLEKSYQSKIKSLEENVEKLKTENERLVEEAANYLRDTHQHKIMNIIINYRGFKMGASTM